MLERELEAYFRTQCQRLGLITIKLNIQQNQGWPDRLVLKKGKAYFSELKTLTGKQTPLQKLRAAMLESFGFPVPILRSKVQILAYLEEIWRA